MKKILSWFERQVNPYPQNSIQIPSNNLLKFILNGVSELKFWLILMIILSSLYGVLEAYIFKIISQVVDWLDNSNQQSVLQDNKWMLWIIAGVFLASWLIYALQAIIHYQTIQGNLPMLLRWNFHRIMLEQSFNFYQNEFAGRIATKVMQTSLALREVVIIFIDLIIYLIVYIISITVILMNFDLLLLLPFAIWALVFIGLQICFIPRLSRSSKIQADARSLMSGRITDAYANITTVKLFSYNAREANYTKQAMNEFLDTVYQQMRLVSKIQISHNFINFALLFSVLLMSLSLWQDSLISTGAVAASTAMALRLNGLSHYVMWQMAVLFENIGTLRDGLATFTKRLSVKDKPNAGKLVVNKGYINFEQLTFAYQDKNLFDNFNLIIKPGEKIGIVGRSGSGKTTLANLLLRFYDINSGVIKIDDTDITTVTQESLREQIGMVSQDTSLLHRTIRENLMYGRPHATEQEMIQAAKKSQAHEFIVNLTDKYGNTGYDVQVGERGVKLSGGQRQRIAIARVMLKNAPILLLDEATSALDSEVEAAIQDSLDDLMQDKTVIAIAHRLSTIAAMDRLVVLDKGKIVEQGSHEQLLQQNGLYARLWNRQSGGFLSEH